MSMMHEYILLTKGEVRLNKQEEQAPLSCETLFALVKEASSKLIDNVVLSDPKKKSSILFYRIKESMCYLPVDNTNFKISFYTID